MTARASGVRFRPATGATKAPERSPAAESPEIGHPGIPSYAPRLAALHRAHHAELRELVRGLPFSKDGRHLDVACGDGTFALLAAQHCAQVAALDNNARYFENASREHPEIEWVLGDAFAMPFAENSFDSALCAQSLYSLGDVPALLAEMKRLVRSEGWCALLENDTMHHVLLPWPPELEVRLRAAELEALAKRSGQPSAYYLARQLSEVLSDAGFVKSSQRTRSLERHAPLDEDEREFLSGYLAELRDRVQGYLSPNDRRWLDRVIWGAEEPALLERSDLHVVVLDVMGVGWVP